MELVSIRDLNAESRILLLRELGYDSDGEWIYDADGRKVFDRYTEEPVRLDRMAILPGSTIILDDNPVSISNYFEEFGEAEA